MPIGWTGSPRVPCFKCSRYWNKCDQDVHCGLKDRKLEHFFG